jgi:hypothetical protein
VGQRKAKYVKKWVEQNNGEIDDKKVTFARRA